MTDVAPLSEIDASLVELGADLGATVTCEQHDGEGDLVRAIHGAADFDGLLINPAAYTHTSVATRDALLGVGVPFVEVHLSVPEAREEFRHISLVADIAVARVSGFGPNSYGLALRGLVDRLRASSQSAG